MSQPLDRKGFHGPVSRRVPARGWPTLCALWLLAPAAWANPPEVALLTDLQGQVEIRPVGGTWRPATLDAGLLLGDTVRTHDRSSTEIRFVDGSVLMLSERTRVRITTALFNPAEAPPLIRVALAAGAVEVRAQQVPLEVTAEGGRAHRIEPGDAARIEAGPAGLDRLPPREVLPVDLAPAEAPAESPIGAPPVEPVAEAGGGGVGEASPGGGTPPPAAEGVPAEVPAEPPVVPADSPRPTRVRVRVRVRAEATP